MKKVFFFIIAVVISVSPLFSQTLKGVISGEVDKGKEPLEGAVIRWLGVKKGALTDVQGRFEISLNGISNKKITVQYIGYVKDTIDVSDKDFVEITLKASLTTQQINVESEQSSSYTGNENSKTEIITQSELKKAACCDLSGCFGKNASVDVAVTDILTNTKELKVLGLEGAYTQILIDNVPMMTGLVTKFGVSGIPGTLVDKITVSKGSNSVIQGYESISGIMNVLLKDYSTSEPLMLNGYLNSGLEQQVNLNLATKMKNEKWSTLLALQTVQESMHMDENKDGFLDAPLVRRYMIYNKWKYGKVEDDKTLATFGLKYINERRVGGQSSFHIEHDLGSPKVYGQTVEFDDGDVYSRISRKLGEKTQMKIYLNGSFFNQTSYYGITKYTGKQRDFYANAIVETELFTNAYYRFGSSYRYETIDENIDFLQPTSKTYAGYYEKLESIPGIFSEASVDIKSLNMSLIGGVRLDNHNKYGLITTPRFLVRYQLGSGTVFRASFGTGFRTVNLFSEYSNHLASGKDIIISGELKPERMINYGIDILQYYNLGFATGTVNLDYYRTDFTSKVVPDYDSNPLAITFSSLPKAGSDVFQVETGITFFKKFEFKLAYKYIDLFYFTGDTKYENPYNAKHRILSGLSYSTPEKSWIFNVSMQWFGKQNLPSTAGNPVQYQRPSESDPYTILNAQISKNFKNFEIYAGAENLLNFTQENPIISAENPSSVYFDTSNIWGPTRGREFYLGARFMLH